MTNQEQRADVATSEAIEKKGFFAAGTGAVEKLASVAADRGPKATSVAAGIVILLLLIGEFLTTGDYVPNHGEIIGLIIGGVLIVFPMIANSLEYKWRLSSDIRKAELITQQLKIEADYKIAQLKETTLETPPMGGEKTPPQPK